MPDNAPHNNMDTDMLAVIKRLQERIEQLEAGSLEQEGKVVYKHTRATTLKLYDELEAYPAITERDLFNGELPKDHDVFNWNDFHFTEGVQYKAPPVLQHPGAVSLSAQAKLHDTDLQSIQMSLANHTRFFDTFAYEIVDDGHADTELGQRVFNYLNMLRIATVHEASKISRMRRKIYGDAINVNLEDNLEGSLLPLEQLAAAKATQELVRKTYKKYEPPKDKTKRFERQVNKSRSSYSDSQKERQSSRSPSRERSKRTTDKGKPYKVDGDKSGSKHRFKPRSSSGKKRADSGNDGEKSD
ncbi:hypothetical protein BGW41_006581 [Actinomortierella wolfii]|nr:hypothetical protein BGW41_006581 [Actinomortierella wolfii]